jgi:hypothetical protein
MSFIRRGLDGSDLYIYERGDGKKQCDGCPLAKRLPDRTDAELAAYVPDSLATDRELWRARWEEDFATADLAAMLAHVAEHRAAGHCVPDYLETWLREDWESGG